MDSGGVLNQIRGRVNNGLLSQLVWKALRLLPFTSCPLCIICWLHLTLLLVH